MKSSSDLKKENRGSFPISFRVAADKKVAVVHYSCKGDLIHFGVLPT